MLYAHFTTKQQAEEIYKGRIQPPFHLTTDLKRGRAYGSYMVLYEVIGDFSCKVNRVGLSDKINQKANGMVEYVLCNSRDILTFTRQVEKSGVRHCVHIEHLIK